MTPGCRTPWRGPPERSPAKPPTATTHRARVAQDSRAPGTTRSRARGAVNELLGLARIPPRRRSRLVRDAIDQGVEFLLSRDPGVADYPMPSRDTNPASAWFKAGFPAGYVTDVIQNLEVLAELGHANDSRLQNALR